MNNHNSCNSPTRPSSLRLASHNYSAGTYFVTICTVERIPYFTNPEIQHLLLETWQGLPIRFPGVTLDEFIIMPDHIHGILWLRKEKGTPLVLGEVIGTFKSLSARAWHAYSKEQGIAVPKILWQRGYYDHIIRNEQDLATKRKYIQDNPLKELERKEGG